MLVDGWTPKTGAYRQPGTPATRSAAALFTPNVPTNQSATGGLGPAAISSRIRCSTASLKAAISATGLCAPGVSAAFVPSAGRGLVLLPLLSAASTVARKVQRRRDPRPQDPSSRQAPRTSVRP